MLKVDLGLIQRRTKQVITEKSSLTLSSRFANRQPVEPQRIALNDPVLRIERQKLVQRELLAAIKNVALILGDDKGEPGRSEEHTSELQSLMRISYDVFCLKKKTTQANIRR